MQPTPGTSAAVPSTLIEKLYLLMDDIVREIDTTAHVTLAIARRSEPWTVFFTDPTAEALNDIEHSSGGPALDALWSGRVARIESTLSNVQWPEYIEVCKHHGVGSVVAFPISIDSDLVGVMTVASNDYYAFGPEETRMGLTAGTRVANILSSSVRCPALITSLH